MSLYFQWAFPWSLMSLSDSSYVYWTFGYLLNEWVACSHIFLVVLLVCLSCFYLFERVLYIFWKQLLYQIYAMKELSPSLWAPIHSLHGDFSWTKFLVLNYSSLSNFSLTVCVLLCYFIKSLPVSNSGGYSLMWSSLHLTTWNWFCVWCEGKIHFFENMTIQLTQHYLWKGLSFPHDSVVSPLS